MIQVLQNTPECPKVGVIILGAEVGKIGDSKSDVRSGAPGVPLEGTQEVAVGQRGVRTLRRHKVKSGLHG